MEIYCLKGVDGFYIKGLSTIPEGASQISESLYTELMYGVSESKRVSFDSFPPKLIDVSPTNTSSTERGWRDAELSKADIELFKLQDSDESAISTAEMWQKYRRELRDWPQNEKFPDINHRPISPR